MGLHSTPKPKNVRIRPKTNPAHAESSSQMHGLLLLHFQILGRGRRQGSCSGPTAREAVGAGEPKAGEAMGTGLVLWSGRGSGDKGNPGPGVGVGVCSRSLGGQVRGGAESLGPKAHGRWACIPRALEP